MPIRRVVVPDAPTELIDALARLAGELELPGEFPAEVLAEAEELARSGPIDKQPRTDLTELPFVTIDPPGSTDLDQALFIERHESGYRVWYAITDLGAWLRPGGATSRPNAEAKPSMRPRAAAPCTRPPSARTRPVCWPMAGPGRPWSGASISIRPVRCAILR